MNGSFIGDCGCVFSPLKKPRANEAKTSPRRWKNGFNNQSWLNLILTRRRIYETFTAVEKLQFDLK